MVIYLRILSIEAQVKSLLLALSIISWIELANLIDLASILIIVGNLVLNYVAKIHLIIRARV